jgi:hypothetical protein
LNHHVVFTRHGRRREDIRGIMNDPAFRDLDRANRQAADAATIKSLQAAGMTSLRAIAANLNERGKNGRGTWQAVQVSRVQVGRVPARQQGTLRHR